MTTTCIHSPLLTLTIANQYAHRRCRQQGWYECELLASDNGVYKNIDGQRHELWDEVVQSGAEEEFRVGVEERFKRRMSEAVRIDNRRSATLIVD